MGYIAHDMVVVTAGDYGQGREWWPDVDAFRESLPEQWRALVVGPIKSITNGYLTWVFAPDGSKSGWDTDTDGDEYRDQFVDLFAFAYEDGSSPFDIVRLQYGGDMAHEIQHPRADYARVR